MSEYRIEHLPNGLIRVFDIASNLSGCYHADGSYHHGDLCWPTLAELLATKDEEKDEIATTHLYYALHRRRSWPWRSVVD